MNFNKFEDEDVIGSETLSPQLQAQVDSITKECQKLTQGINNIEKQFVRLTKQNNQQQLKIFKENSSKQLLGLQQISIVTVQNKINELSISLSSLDQSQKQIVSNKINVFKSQVEQKISKFQLITQDSNIQEDNQSNQQQMKDFKMGLIQKEAEEQIDDVKNIHQDMNEINNLMKQMSNQVYKGGETINLISEHVEEADKNVEKGVKNLLTAKKTQKSKNKWLFIGLGVVAAIVVILLLIFLI